MTSQAETPPPRLRGRPPSEAARNKALQAARDILLSEGFGRLTIEAVVAKSGISKPTTPTGAIEIRSSVGQCRCWRAGKWRNPIEDE